MANQKILDQKQKVIDEIAEKTKNSSSVVLFEYQGLTTEDTNNLRRMLKESGSEFKIYKNTLTKRAFDSLNIDMDDELTGPKAIAFSDDSIAPIKVLYDFSKKNKALVVKKGLIDGEITEEDKLRELSKIPSREGLLTMLAGGLIGTVRNLSIALDLRANQLEEK
ncbi:MAG: 50S ribosomal protein L10 [Bacilli bacterium]|nr:50S ribosomal protein L10 [Bacilli bacterium]MBR3152793.1 50S ribosomal protein L10 [Clostridia bacterium]